MTDKPWVANGPEDRFSIAVTRFLDRTLIAPRYFNAALETDGGKRSVGQHARDINRGRRPGTLDFDVVQGPPYLHRKLELKRGKNRLSAHQVDTVSDLTACGGAPIVAWTLREVWGGLFNAGFRFTPNFHTVLAELEAHLEQWDHQASLIKSGAVVRKPKSAKKEPRYTMSKSGVARARRAGILT